MSSVAPRSDDERIPAQPRVLYLLTAEISSVLVRGQLDWLASEGFDVHVGVKLDDGSSAHRWDVSATLHEVPFTRRISPLRDLRALVTTVRLIRRLRPDIVNASTPKAGLLGMLAARACRVPVRVYVLRGLRFETTAGLTRLLLTRLERVTEWCATSVLTNSPSAARVAADAGIGRRRKLQLIGAGSSNGVDLGHFAPASAADRSAARASLGVPLDARVVGFIGRLTRDKGITDVLHAFDALRQDRADVHLLVVGDHEPGDPAGDEVEQQLNDRADITQIPWVPDTAAIYPAIDVLVFASAREGLPNVPLQAQATGVPVVAYAATGTVDAVEHGVGGLLIPLGDRSALAGAVATLIDANGLRHALGAAGPDWVRQRFEQQQFWEELTANYRTWMQR